MTDLVAQLSQRALELAPEDRARLAEELLLFQPGSRAVAVAPHTSTLCLSRR